MNQSDDDNIRAWPLPGTKFLVWPQADQLTIEFQAAGSVAEALLHPETDDFQKALNLLHDRTKELWKKKRTSLEEAGIRVFDIRRYNDFSAVEADYGAPAQGLDFVADLFHPERAFRYEPVHKIEGVFKTHVRQSQQIGANLRAQGYRIFDKLDLEQYPSQIHFANGGVTGAFSSLIEKIAGQHERLQKHKAVFGRTHHAAMIVPVPTYGLFLYRMQEILEGRGIDILRVRRNEDGSVNEQSLRATLDECRSKNIRVLSYYDCNPHNPTGHVRGREETERVGDIITTESEYYIEDDLRFLMESCSASIRDDEKKRNALHKWVGALKEIHGGIVMIDDMAYEGLELSDDVVPSSFGQVSHEVAQRTVVLKGISKIGCPGARIGMVVGHPGIIAPMADLQLTQQFCANSFGVDILTARYGDPSIHGEKFKAHANNLRRLHLYKAGVIEAFFRGLDATGRLDRTQKEKLVDDYAAYAQITQDEAEKRLKAGLTQFHLPEGMDCGFFYRVNCEQLRGKLISTQFEGEDCISTAYIQDANALYWIFRSFDIHTVPATSQGCPEGTLSVRITTSLPDQELFRFYDNMRSMQEYFFGKDPAVQLDLFRSHAHLTGQPELGVITVEQAYRLARSLAGRCPE